MIDRQTCLEYLRRNRRAVLRAVHGVPEYDARRPLTRSGTNLLGVVKHLALVELEYVSDCAGFPCDLGSPWKEADEAINGDLWLTADESAESVIALYVAAGEHTERAAATLPIDSPATVPWWSKGDTTFDRLLVHLVSETAQHAGHLDILREGIDGQGDTWDETRTYRDDAWWSALLSRIAAAAEPFRGSDSRVAAPEGTF
ncbi:DinB family protein [Aeromicrobium duanguangcaii]|uniref:DinB family protein n=1 Tax=Aeromicrobium duanguangcaii TaxID=2968086 RepID=A0ABY5KCW5_9ACTN|nr:DinB family protein [Aeromicrobium duanguangcaii]MCD9155433.1 DinB family protein [Aeromicrobium duanguangcaii]UUI68296.1 DinB family protein [Aeromicrobium duanguangcaii]